VTHPDRLVSRRARIVLASAVALFAAAVLARNDPERSSIFPACPIWQSTGLHCSGCGSTRAMHHLLNARIGMALRYNPLAVISIPLLIVMSLRPDRFRQPSIAWLAAVILIGYAVLRNVDRWPFRYLAPPSVNVSIISKTSEPGLAISILSEALAVS